jgi:tetratricopeptide (TPR) repeat protein
MIAASVKNEKLTIPAYRLLPGDLNPMFDRKLNPYPYTLQNARSEYKENVEYDVVILENEYLILTVIPSLGGRLYSVVDKRNGRDVFYKNQVIKPRMIGTRGAWFSGGVEFNFPISHSPTTMDRVNYQMQNYEDGSVSIIFGNIELISGMNWKVELKLYPGKAYIEENVSLYNPTTSENRFYFWTNAAVEYNKNIELIYPFDWCINHIEPDYIKWPFYKGINFSEAGNVPYAYETFGKLMTGNFFGIYDHGNDCGMVHYADRKLLKGAKFFHWGNDDMATSWNRALTDDDSKYLEIQSGLFESQSVFKFLKPHQELSWSEYWYPVSGMKGFKYAEKELAINYKSVDKGLELTLCAMEELKNCEIVLKTEDKEYRILKDLIPDRTEIICFELDKHIIVGTQFQLDIFSDTRHLLNLGKRDEFNEEVLDLDLYEDSRVVMDEKQKERIFKSALLSESLGVFEEAFDLYKRNLQENPTCTLTLNRLGRMYIRKGLFKEAVECFMKVLRYDNRNSEARFLMAAAEKEKGNLKKARSLMMDIAADGNYYHASVIELIKLDIAAGYYKEGAELLDTYLKFNNYSSFLKSVSYRMDGLEVNAQITLDSCKKADELILAERYLLYSDQKSASELVAFTEGDERVLLRIILEYIDLNLFRDANAILELIKKPGIKCLLLKLYISRKTKQEYKPILLDVLSSSLDFVFINERKIVSIINENLELDTSGKLDYLLGTYYYSIGLKDSALSSFLSSYNKGLRYTVLLRNIGYLYYNYKKDIDSALKYFKEDLHVNHEQNEESIIYLDRIFKEKGDLDSRQELLPFIEKSSNRALVLKPLIEILRDMGKEEKALSFLENEEFENWEGAEISGPCYKSVIISKVLKDIEAGNIQKAKETIDRVDKYPVGLNYGDSSRTTLADMNYYKGIIYSLAGEEGKAVEEFKKGAIELENTLIIGTEESKMYSLKCLGELEKRK